MGQDPRISKPRAERGVWSTVDTTVTTSVLAGVSTGISFRLAAGKTYVIRGNGIVSSGNATSGVQFALVASGGLTAATDGFAFRSAEMTGASSQAVATTNALGSFSPQGTGPTTPTSVVFDALIRTATGGTVTLWIAPETDTIAASMQFGAMECILVS